VRFARAKEDDVLKALRAPVLLVVVALCAVVVTHPVAAGGQGAAQARRPAAEAYFPPSSEWTHKASADVGLSAAHVDAAVKLAVANESRGSREMRAYLQESYGREPQNEPIGPFVDRGPASGLIIRNGFIVAEWGEPSRVDMTFSVTKTFLTTVVGLAWQRGLIKSVDDRVAGYMPEDVDLFHAAHNRTITWDHLLRQVSDWQGTLWGKPDWVDRPEGPRETWENRALHEPGSRFKYNDVRINVLALATLYIWKKPLPDVLRDQVMEPIGASSTWRWHGYDNSWVNIDGKRVQSVSGGAHWGGGMFINSYDLGRFGYLFLRNGTWRNRRILSEDWIRMARTPGTANREYGYANWYLNTDRRPLPKAPASAVYFLGNGNNIVYIDWDHDIVAVCRWMNSLRTLDDFAGLLSTAAGTASE
jgi:hypothetical protein